MIKLVLLPGPVIELPNGPYTVAELRALCGAEERREPSINGNHYTVRKHEEATTVVPPDSIVLFRNPMKGNPGPPEYWQLTLPCNGRVTTIKELLDYYFLPGGVRPYSHAHHVRDFSFHCPDCGADHLHTTGTYIGPR